MAFFAKRHERNVALVKVPRQIPGKDRLRFIVYILEKHQAPSFQKLEQHDDTSKRRHNVLWSLSNLFCSLQLVRKLMHAA